MSPDEVRARQMETVLAEALVRIYGSIPRADRDRLTREMCLSVERCWHDQLITLSTAA